jgi:hypothetical protein
MGLIATKEIYVVMSLDLIFYDVSFMWHKQSSPCKIEEMSGQSHNNANAVYYLCRLQFTRTPSKLSLKSIHPS